MPFTIQQINNQLKNKLKNVYSNAEIQQLLFLIYKKAANLSKIQVLTNYEMQIPEHNYNEITDIANRLANNEPIDYIIGETEFFNLQFIVNPSVLIPRPETEELVHWVLTDYNKKQKILDIGTGSGCIAVSLAKNMQNAEVFAVDISKQALETAKKNAQNNGAKINFAECNILNADYTLLPQGIDIIISNPPYVRQSEKTFIKPNVLDYEPELALFVTDNNPIVFYKEIALAGKKILNNNGLIFFEINEALAKEVKNMLEELQYSQIEIRKDINGKKRMVKAMLTQ